MLDHETFFNLAFFLRVRAMAAAREALVADFRRSSAVMFFERAIPPMRAISRTSMGNNYHRAGRIAIAILLFA
jgi:hypothetical protein